MQIVNRPQVKYDTISIPFLTGSQQTKLNFPDQPNLRDAKVWGVELVFATRDYYQNPVYNYSAGTGGADLITYGFITLYSPSTGKEFIQNMPLSEIAIAQSGANGSGSAFAQYPYNINGNLPLSGQRVTWTKSFISLSQPVPPSADCVILLGVYYTL